MTLGIGLIVLAAVMLVGCGRAPAEANGATTTSDASSAPLSAYATPTGKETQQARLDWLKKGNEGPSNVEGAQ
jgi:hypothetical protein